MSAIAVEPVILSGAPAWRRSDKLAVIVGAIALGGFAGLFATFMGGRMTGDADWAIAAPILAFALLLSGLTLWRASVRRARGCATAACLHIVGVLAWPAVWAVAQTMPILFWAAPALALGAIALFASCWQGRAWAIYGAAGQAVLLAALAAHQSLFVALGG